MGYYDADSLAATLKRSYDIETKLGGSFGVRRLPRVRRVHRPRKNFYVDVEARRTKRTAFNAARKLREWERSTGQEPGQYYVFSRTRQTKRGKMITEWIVARRRK